MQIATLISNPKDRLDETMIAGLMGAWSGRDLRWLSARRAAEFTMPTAPQSFASAWNMAQKQGVDLVLQSADTRRKSLLIADMDSTLIEEECIDELADAAGLGPKVAQITRRAMNGEIDFERALADRVALLEGLPETTIDQVIAERITPTPGGATLVETMKQSGAHATIVSGGFTAFTARVAQALGFDDHHANTLIAKNGHLTGAVADPILGRDAKVDVLSATVQRLAIKTESVLAVGDGANDLGMLGIAGLGVALHAKPSVQKASKARINHSDLTALLYLQGYSDAEISWRADPDFGSDLPAG
ncbi:MAG: phosphoserine phosphatase SerB [Pseudomonadota bacterium]